MKKMGFRKTVLAVALTVGGVLGVTAVQANSMWDAATKQASDVAVTFSKSFFEESMNYISKVLSGNVTADYKQALDGFEKSLQRLEGIKERWVAQIDSDMKGVAKSIEEMKKLRGSQKWSEDIIKAFDRHIEELSKEQDSLRSKKTGSNFSKMITEKIGTAKTAINEAKAAINSAKSIGAGAKATLKAGQDFFGGNSKLKDLLPASKLEFLGKAFYLADVGKAAVGAVGSLIKGKDDLGTSAMNLAAKVMSFNPAVAVTDYTKDKYMEVQKAAQEVPDSYRDTVLRYSQMASDHNDALTRAIVEGGNVQHLIDNFSLSREGHYKELIRIKAEIKGSGRVIDYMSRAVDYITLTAGDKDAVIALIEIIEKNYLDGGIYTRAALEKHVENIRAAIKKRDDAAAALQAYANQTSAEIALLDDSSNDLNNLEGWTCYVCKPNPMDYINLSDADQFAKQGLEEHRIDVVKEMENKRGGMSGFPSEGHDTPIPIDGAKGPDAGSGGGSTEGSTNPTNPGGAMPGSGGR